MLDILNNVRQKYPELRRAYLQGAAAVEAINTVIRVRAPMDSLYFSPLVSSETARTAIPPDEFLARPFMNAFLSKLTSFRVLTYIPTLIHFYQLLNKMFAHKITKDQMQLPIPQCIKILKVPTPLPANLVRVVSANKP